MLKTKQDVDKTPASTTVLIQKYYQSFGRTPGRTVFGEVAVNF